MKLFFVKLIVFCFPVILLFVGMEVLLRRIPNDYQYKKEILVKQSDELEILCLGSSHAYYNVNPKLFKKKGFNVSHIAQSLDLDLALLRKYGPDLHKLKVILVPVSYFSLYGKLNSGQEPWRVKNYWLYYQLDVPRKLRYNFELLSLNLDLNIARCYEYYVKKKSAITSSPEGFGTNYHSSVQVDLTKSGKESALRHTKENDSHFKENRDDLVSIIEFAGNRNIEVILFTSPAYHTYTENLNNVQLSRTINEAVKLDKIYPHVRYYNFMKDPSFTEKDYYDADHLNEIGAAKFSGKLWNLIAEDTIHPNIPLTGIQTAGTYPPAK